MRRILLALSLIAAGASAQVPLAPGARVRLIPSEKRDMRRAGRLISLDSDSALVNFEPVPKRELRADRLRVARDRLEALTSTRRYGLFGTVVGALALGITGNAISGPLTQACIQSPYMKSPSCSTNLGEKRFIVEFGAVTGALVGGIVGHLVKTETWTPLTR